MTSQANTLIDTTFNWQTALSLAMSSKLAYQRAAAIESVAKNQWGYDDCTFISRKDTQLFVAIKGDKGLVAFRGTDGIADWFNNFKAIPKYRSEFGLIHTGFHQAFQAVKTPLSNLLASHGDNLKVWVTGHSLGGALATFCLAELEETHRHQIQACYTFGQPRVGDKRFADFMKANYGESYFRFVNDNDIVTRIPPGYRHIGTVVHFAADGSLLSSPTTSDSSDEIEALGLESNSEFAATEPPALTEDEFERFLANDEDAESLDDSSLEGLNPIVQAHSMDAYIGKITSHERISPTRNDVETVFIDRQVERASEKPLDSADGAKAIFFESINGSDPIPVLIKTIPGWLPPDDITINSTIGSIHTAMVTSKQLDRLRQDTENIISINLSSDASIPEGQASIPFVNAHQVHRPPLNEKGDQAIVGIIDTGIDVLHQAFTNVNDPTKSRILYIWDQNGSSEDERTPTQINPLFSAGYGRVYTQSDIEQFMESGLVPAERLRDPKTHGTHVAGIAAGRSVGTIGDGVAPEAMLAVVIPKLKTLEGDPPSIGYSVTHLDGLLFLKEASRLHNLPMAINVSLGKNAGAHDGSSTLEAGFDTILEQGRLPGLVIVKSAGNERGFKGHAKVNVTTNLFETISWRSKDKFRNQDYIEGWYDAFDDLQFILIAPSKKTSEPISFDQNAGPPDEPQTINGVLDGSQFELSLTKYHGDNGHSLLQIIITPSKPGKKIRKGIWKLEILRRTIGSTDGRVDFWIERYTSRAINFEQGADDSMTLSIPGAANHVITVAACAPEGPPIRLTSSSSYGPTRLKGKKPEITAPGDKIFAAGANTDDPTNGIGKTGTSMAAPHVTGAIALAMSKLHKLDSARQFNAVQYRQALIASSMDASRNHHPGRGFGILDVEKFFNSL